MVLGERKGRPMAGGLHGGSALAVTAAKKGLTKLEGHEEEQEESQLFEICSLLFLGPFANNNFEFATATGWRRRPSYDLRMA